MTGQLVDEQYLYEIANAIRNKNGESTLYRSQDMANAILNIQSFLNTSLIDRSITTYSNDKITNIGDGAFSCCSLLTSVNLPNVTRIGEIAFSNCTSLATFNLPACTSIGNSAFANCSSLTSINLPNVTSIEAYAFTDCSLLTSVNLPNVTSIKEYAFFGCTSLTSITLSTATVCTGGLMMLSYTSISSNAGYIYVPANLVNAYKIAPYWSDYASRIVAIT